LSYLDFGERAPGKKYGQIVLKVPQYEYVLCSRPGTNHKRNLSVTRFSKGGASMEYKNIEGSVFSRQALSPPIINSELASEYGIQAPCLVEPGQYSGPEVGRSVKLRIVVNGGTKKMTCHGTIDWVRPDGTGTYHVGFGNLSLSDEEFKILTRYFTTGSEIPVEFVPRLREKAPEADPVVVTEVAQEILRYKAVHFPVSVIELIDEHRGEDSFSEFVTKAVRMYVKQE
jgi:hypothetical protein